MAVRLGSVVQDTMTGLQGIAIGRTDWLYGCSRIAIQPQALHEGKPVESYWVDEQRVEVLEERGPVVSAASSATSGGPQADPIY